ncbi:MAG: potassium transporter TrkA [Candidatus Omnitrophica bacterium CG11_big_fil_rev_8_21_14_0_20_41_12]|nr:MAG: potassium transporter TrkA [Candidatus Omnitrophica bacterium CG11_big_fil_rev_8_21_14_0_20_41_12]
MIALFGLLIIIIMSIIVVRIGAIALELTGLSSEIASFQSQSAFSGAGFTTVESEAIVTHPVRRRIIKVLILLGSAGVTTAIASLVLTFVGPTEASVITRGEVLLLGLLCIFLFARSKYIYNVMKIIVIKALEKWTTLRIYDYEQLFGLGEGYAIAKITVKKDNPYSEMSLKDLKPQLEGVLILAIYRKAGRKTHFIGAPHGDVVLKVNDELICYAKEDIISKIFSVPKQ